MTSPPWTAQIPRVNGELNFIRSHMNCRPIHPPEKKMKFQSLVETGGVRHAKVP
jgi:hypothetical protein